MTRTGKLVISATALFLGVGLATAGCTNKQQQKFNDAPRTATQNNDPAQIITMPDGFNNVASKCDGANRVYVIYHNDSSYGSVAVVPNDPRCTGH